MHVYRPCFLTYMYYKCQYAPDITWTRCTRVIQPCTTDCTVFVVFDLLLSRCPLSHIRCVPTQKGFTFPSSPLLTPSLSHPQQQLPRSVFIVPAHIGACSHRLSCAMVPLQHGVVVQAVALSTAAGLCSALGALILVFLSGFNIPPHRMAFAHAALATSFLFLACFDLLPEALAGISLLRTILCFIFGVLFSALFARFLRSPSCTAYLHLLFYRTNLANNNNNAFYSEVLLVGIVIFVSMSVHNILEGMSILFAVREGLETGIRLAAAISLENIPEGACIAISLFYVTRSRMLAVRMALISGMMEPVGVLIAAFVMKNYLTQTYISSTIAIIAGVLVFVALAEMLPLAVKSVTTRTFGALSMWMACGVLCAILFQPLLMYHARVGKIE